MEKPIKRKKGILLDPNTGDLKIVNGDLVTGEINYPLPPAKFPESTDEAMEAIFCGKIDENDPTTKEFFSNVKKELTQMREDFKDSISEHNYELAQILLNENKGLETSILQLAKNKTEKTKPLGSYSVNKTYSFDCDYSKNKIITELLPIFQRVFECSEIEIINLMSENITTEISPKHGVLLNDIVFFFDLLVENRILKTPQIGSIIEKSKCIIWRNMPLTSNKIKQSRKALRKGSPSHFILQETASLRKV